MKLVFFLLLITAVIQAESRFCLSFYRVSISETEHPTLNLPEAVTYDIYALANSWRNPFSPDRSNFQTDTYSQFSITRLRENPKTGQLPREIFNENYLYQLGLSSLVSLPFLRQQRDESLSQIYNNYLKQGPERRDNVLTYQREDIDFRDRTTHFLLHEGSKTVGRIQLQHSLNPSQQLNVETHFPERASAVIRKRKEAVFFELGRLHIPDPKKDGVGLDNSFSRKLAFFELFLRPLMYVAKNEPSAAIVMQTNHDVLERIRKRFAPYKLTNITIVSKPGDPLEYLTIIPASEIKNATRTLFLKRAQLIIENYLKSNFGELRLTIHPDEKNLYDELDVTSLATKWLQKNLEPVWRKHMNKSLYDSLGSSAMHIKVNVNFNLDSSHFINPHFISLGQEEANILLQRIQNNISELGLVVWE
ncbi:MAG: hypothetical protein HUU56_04670 [Bdellovibrionaceae bacterium]|nr:hypothetical protein [Pseudobdellovibrionaceae bacterium]